MEDESEKRFHSIMDKLFYYPKPKTTTKSNSSSSRGKMPSNLTSALMAMDSRSNALRYQSSTNANKSLQHVPLCRPWDRGDLLKRLATFKAMTWFGKPKVVNAINCARRGWINIDMNILSCESCGARLLFSNPSSWTQQQVEKAALVFSLKLDSGHKQPCPWIDNPCDEKLAQFPPMLAPVLVEGYRERSSALLQLLALPIISSSAFENVKSPQLEHFIRQSLIQEHGNVSDETSRPTYNDNECDAASANLYYQALKLISICGWEPRSLAYVVENKSLSNQTAKDATHLNFSQITTNGHDVHVYPTSTADHHSVVLDCKFCGATIGLWAFSTTSRPVEMVRLVGYSEVGSENENHLSKESLREKSSHLNMTIAGGPPPAKQNFKATISLPVIGQNLRARFSSDFKFRDLMGDNVQSDSVSISKYQKGKDHIEEDTQHGQVQATGILKRKRDNDGNCGSTSDAQLPYSTKDVMLDESLLPKEIDSQMSLDNMIVTVQETHDSTKKSTVESTEIIAHESSQNQDLSQNEGMRQIFVNGTVSCGIAKDLKQQSLHKDMEFDPIRQHRHFCPWISSTGSAVPGWQQTLSAIQRQKECSHPSPTKSPPAASTIEVDDPIASVRRLFMSPLAKRIKSTPSPVKSIDH